jgi:hypothetical protein
MGRFGHPPWPRDDEPASPGRSAAERGNQIGRISKIPPLPRPALGLKIVRELWSTTPIARWYSDCYKFVGILGEAVYIVCQPSGVACSASPVNSMTIHVPSSTALALGASSIMFATVMTDISDEHYTSSSFVSFYGLVGVGLTPPVVFAPPARMDDPDWLPCRVGASSYLPDGGYGAGRSVRFGMIVFLALDSPALPGRVLLGPKPRRGHRRGQITGRRVATSRDAVDLKELTQSDFAQFWIKKIAGVAVCGSNPIDGGLSKAHGIRMSRTLRASRAVQTAEFQLVMSSSRDGELSEVCYLAPTSHLPVQPSRDKERRTRLQPAFLGKDPARAAGQKVAHSRVCAGHCHCGSGVGIPAASAPEFNTHQARQSKRGHFPPKALQVRRSRSRHPKIRCPRGISRDRSFRRNLWTPAYGDAVANVRSSRNFPEPKRNRGASRCPFTQRG